MDNLIRSFHIATNLLPAVLAKLVKATGFKPKTVEIELYRGPAEVYRTWRTGQVVGVEGFRKLSTETKHWMGSDGESNSATTETYSLPVAITTPKCGARTKNMVCIAIGNMLVCPASDDLAALVEWSLVNESTLPTEADPVFSRVSSSAEAVSREESRRAAITPAKSAQVELMEQLGLA